MPSRWRRVKGTLQCISRLPSLRQVQDAASSDCSFPERAVGRYNPHQALRVLKLAKYYHRQDKAEELPQPYTRRLDWLPNLADQELLKLTGGLGELEQLVVKTANMKMPGNASVEVHVPFGHLPHAPSLGTIRVHIGFTVVCVLRVSRLHWIGRGFACSAFAAAVVGLKFSGGTGGACSPHAPPQPCIDLTILSLRLRPSPRPLSAHASHPLHCPHTRPQGKG